MAQLYKVPHEHIYKLRQPYFSNLEDQMAKINVSNTVYVGNLAFFTQESQIYEFFSRCGLVKKVIMGVNKITKQPCGFCFVKFHDHETAVNCMKYFSGAKLDNRFIQIEVDWGFSDGRQYGRGENGFQIRDTFKRKRFDRDRDTRIFDDKSGSKKRSDTYIPNIHKRHNFNN